MPTNKPVGSTHRSLLARLLDAFAWRHVGDRGAWHYHKNVFTGARRAVPHKYLYGPQDAHWLAGGDWGCGPQPVPPRGSPTETPPSGGTNGQRPRIRESDVIAIVTWEGGGGWPGQLQSRSETPVTDQRARQMTARPVVRSYHVTTVDGVPSNVIELR